MGLFSKLTSLVSGSPSTSELGSAGNGLSRRSFLVTVQGIAIGHFALPALNGQKEAAAATAITRKLLTAPVLSGSGDNIFLLYVEQLPDGKVETMVWYPASPEEVTEIRRFYDATRGVGPDAPERRKINPGKPVKRSADEMKYLQAIIESGHSERSYLDYADWLTGNKKSLGEFIRVCITIDQTPADDPKLEALNDRWNAMIDKHAKTWLKPILDLGLQPEIMGEFYPKLWLSDKGLVTDLEIDRPGVLPEEAERFFAADPVVRVLDLDDEGIDVAAVAHLPQMTQIIRLDIGSPSTTAADIQAVATSPYLGRLEELEVSFASIGPQAGISLAASPLLSHLRILTLRSIELGDVGAQSLTASPHCRNLKVLGLSDNELTAVGVRAVVSSPNLGGLVTLELESSKPDAESFRALRNAAFLKQLTTLDFTSSELGRELVEILAEIRFESLAILKLSNNGMGSAGTAALARASFFSGLEELELGSNEIGDEGVVALADVPKAAIVDLILDANSITDTGLVALARSKSLTGLSKLSLPGNTFTSEGLRIFAESEMFEILAELDLRDVDLGDEGCQALADSPHDVTLERLCVTEDQLGDRGKRILVERFGEEAVSLF